MSKIIATVGISGSGKTTWAKKYCEEDPKSRVIVGRDKIREMLYGRSENDMKDYYATDGFMRREKQVTQSQDTLVKMFLAKDITVVVDDTHLKQVYLDRWAQFGVPVEVKVIELDVESCVRGDAQRERSVGESVIRRQEKSFYQMIRTMVPVVPKDFIIPNDDTKYPAYIFDIDGTLAHKGDRNAFNWKKIGEDNVDEEIRTQLQILQQEGAAIIICTGRDGVCQQETMQWLWDNDITFDQFYTRPEGSYEPDWKVKEDMWRDITKKYHIRAMWDDRNQVVDHARKCGFKVFQVAEGNF